MPETAELTFPAEARARIAAQHAALSEPRDSDPHTTRILRDAMAVIEHLESDNAALRTTIDFMRERVAEAIRPR